MRKIMNVAILGLLMSVITLSCKDNNEPTTGTLKGTVTVSSTNQAIGDVRITVYDANTNAPIGNSVLTQANGTYQIQLSPGTYYLNLSKQGYNAIPAAGTTAVPVTVALGAETVNDYQMLPSSVVNGGSISGKVTSGGTAVAGVLVVASDLNNGYSAVTGTDGSYYIYNVPVGTYQVQGFLANYNSASLSVTVTASTVITGKNISLTSGATGSVSGAVSFLATNSGEVEVTLVNPLTKEAIPGLATKTAGGTYLISKVPNGTYIARASYSNDTYVVDPDWILKNGEPMVTITGGNAVAQNFSVTGAVTLVSPTNALTTTKPVEVIGLTPTFTWMAYSSTSDYVIEVSDINGNVIWGGLTKTGLIITKNLPFIPKTQLRIVFNSDGTAKTTLKSKNTYRWRVYASKDDNALGWKLISVSEEQQGLFFIQ